MPPTLSLRRHQRVMLEALVIRAKWFDFPNRGLLSVVLEPHAFPLSYLPSHVLPLKHNMSFGGNVEGYLLKIDGDEVCTVYCILDEGMLQYFSRRGGEQLGTFALSGSKVDVFLLPPSKVGQMPNRFRVDAQPRTPSVRRRGTRQCVVADKSVSVTFAGSTGEVTSHWAVSILNWNRYSWEDSQLVCSSKDEFHYLKRLIELCGTKINKTSTDPVIPVGVSPAVLPL
ncbi:unnamed protein product [Peronospora belbahrii]|uniref:PH domain-containing protein n=1 Tax=Peronospora belbahrii TaxID=622444 RepID=A0ABN8D3W1_9STRA|nr:unnamed protein product [Peronospora belbahrii]